jgi:hypothetical protein
MEKRVVWGVKVYPNRIKAQRFFYDKPFSFSVLAKNENEVEDKLYTLYPDIRINRPKYIVKINCKEV